MGSLGPDLRLAVRTLRSAPLFTTVVLITLALGIGGTTALFSLVHGILLRPLPYPEPQHLVTVWETEPGADPLSGALTTASPANFLDWQRAEGPFEHLAAYSFLSVNLGGGEFPERLRAASVTAGFFDVLGIDAQVGRPFHAAADGTSATGESRVVVLSHGLWQRRFAADPRILGRSLLLDGRPHTVVGVMPSGFLYPDRVELWLRAPGGVPELPFAYPGDLRALRGARYLYTIGRLRSDVPLMQARLETSALARRLAAEYPADNDDRTIALVALRQQVVGDVRPALLVLLGAMSLVLLIACSNIASLMLVRSLSRQREIAIRLALGARVRRLIRQTLTESVLLGVLGAACGLSVAALATRVVTAFGPEGIPRLDEVSLDVRVVGFALLLGIGTGLIFGLAPALQVRHARPLEVTRESSGRATASVGQDRLRRALVTAEIGLALTLLIGAGLLLGSFVHLVRIDPGFDPETVLTAQISLPEARYPDEPQIVELYRAVLERLRSLPSVRSASAVMSLPLGGSSVSRSFLIEGRPLPAPGKEPEARFQVVGRDYFQTLRIPLLQGRDFKTADVGSRRVAVINRSMARRFWLGEDPVGRRVTLEEPSKESWLTIVGVVGDVRQGELIRAPEPELYVPYFQEPPSLMTLVVRAASPDPLALAGAVRRQVQAVDSEQPVFNVRTLSSLVSRSVGFHRFLLMLIGLFSLVALVLAVVGIYGVMAFFTAQRTHEIGIRMSLGARRMDILKLVLGQGLLITFLGVVSGLAASLLAARSLSSFLFEIQAVDGPTYTLATVILTLAALGASYFPARRSTRVDPVRAIQSQ